MALKDTEELNGIQRLNKREISKTRRSDRKKKNEEADRAHQSKRGIVITARVHPGETQSSWMVQGLIEFL